MPFIRPEVRINHDERNGWRAESRRQSVKLVRRNFPSILSLNGREVAYAYNGEGEH